MEATVSGQAFQRRWWTIGALTIGSLVIGIDVTVLNLALPTLAGALGATTAQLQWFADAYLLVLSALMLPAGMLGDRYGRKRLVLAALVVFAAGSLASWITVVGIGDGLPPAPATGRAGSSRRCSARAARGRAATATIQ
ncbi:MAG: MFS transporter, partial [Micromonosporaceae bacterium]|nr:MFS transporter [Micromonosporaceae bacterium]